MTYSYRICGLQVSSEIPLPDLEEEAGEAEVCIRLRTPLDPLPPFDGRRRVELRPGIAYHCWAGVGEFLVEQGRRVLVGPADGVDIRLLGHFASRVAFASVLDQRGFQMLHGSAVAAGGRAMVILGDTGAGKSALAAALHLHGCQVLADDAFVVERKDDAAYVRPASQHLHLWPSVAAALGYDPCALSRVTAAEDKLVVPSRSAWPADALPLALVVVITAGSGVETATLPPGDAARTLAAMSFISHVVGEPVDSPAFAAMCARVVAEVPCVRVTRSNIEGDIHEMAERILPYITTARGRETGGAAARARASRTVRSSTCEST